MSAFDFVNHESYPEDQYIAESVTLCFQGRDNKFRVTYIRKKLQNGGMFWGEISASVKQNREKKFLKSFSQDSNFLQEDIKSFLDGRSWEKGGRSHTSTPPQAYPHTHSPSGGYVAQSKSDDEVPF